MYIKRLKIKNYKGFRESDWIKFGPGFNVIVGQNNSGKTALLECIRLHGAENKPHKSAKIPKGHPGVTNGTIEFDLIMKRQEFMELLQKNNRNHLTAVFYNNNQSQIQLIFLEESIEFRMNTINGQSSFYPRGLSSIFPNAANPTGSVTISSASNKNNVSVSLVGEPTTQDNLPSAIFSGAYDRFYVFKAERLALAKFPLADESILLPNGANLAAVLAKFFSSKPADATEYHRHVTRP